MSSDAHASPGKPTEINSEPPAPQPPPPFRPPPGTPDAPPFQPPPFRPPPSHIAEQQPPPWLPPPSAGGPPARPPPGAATGQYYPPPWTAHPRPGPPLQQPRPVSSKPIIGTDWLEVKTDVGTRFWHNTKTGQGVWRMPEEVKAAGKAPPPLDAKKKKMLERAQAAGAVVAPQYKAAAAALRAGQPGGPLLLEGGAAGTAVAVGNANVQQVGQEDEEDFDVTFTEDDIHDGDAGAGGDATKEPKQKTKTESDAPAAKGALVAAESAFRALLADHGIHGFSRYEKELPKLRNDPRFEGVAQNRRKQLFEEYCSEVGMVSRKKSNQQNKKQQAPTAAGAKSKAPSTARGSSKSSKAAEDAYRALLQERVIYSDARWRDVKEDLRGDPRFEGVASSERREELFRAHTDALWKVEEARKKAERRARHEQHAGEERKMQASAIIAEEQFCALLAEAVRDPRAEWSEYWPRLQRDPQGRASHSLLDDHTAQRLFKDHVYRLADSASRAFIELLEEHRSVLPHSVGVWSDAESAVESIIDGDPRYDALLDNMRAVAWQQFRRGRNEDGEIQIGNKGLDPAYAREYLEGRDAKRQKTDGGDSGA